MFWFFAHPAVYIIFIPATGIVSAILPTFCRRKIVGYTALVLASVAVAFIGFGVWVHHMFTTPIPDLGRGLFTASSIMIAIPLSCGRPAQRVASQQNIARRSALPTATSSPSRRSSCVTTRTG